MSIEGGPEEQARFINATKEREDAAAKLWDISCCRQNVFNKENFELA